jgi:D-lactate dehydrogenase
MRVCVFGTQSFEPEPLLRQARAAGHELTFIESTLSAVTAPLAAGFPCVSLFVTDIADAAVLEKLAAGGTQFIALRSAGFNNVDLVAAARLGIGVARVPAYSPNAVAEHAVGLILVLNRKLHRAIARVREHNFALEGLMGFNLEGKTVGLVGVGRIGVAFARIMLGFGCTVVFTDPTPGEEAARLGCRRVAIEELLTSSDIISLHCPLNPQTKHLINAAAFARMKPGAMLINTSRGGVVDTYAAIQALKSGRLGSLGLDVYEEEGDLFFRDLSEQVLQDDVLARLLTFPNVVITAHQAFLTREAVDNIAETTIENVSGFERGSVPGENVVSAEKFVR